MAFLGRAIFPMRIVIRQLLTNTTRAASGYDDRLREFKMVDTNSDGIGTPARSESAELVIPGQVTTRVLDRGDQREGGRVPETPNLEVTLHRRDLKAAGLLAADGRCKIVPGDRLVRIESRSGDVIQDFPDPPGMYLASSRVSGFLGSTANLVVCTFTDRREAPGEPVETQL